MPDSTCDDGVQNGDETAMDCGGRCERALFGVPSADIDICDGVDNDCDDAIDEDFQSVETVCGLGVCVDGGSTLCVDGAVVDDCMADNPQDGPDVCDGTDTDCDGQTDEDFNAEATDCGVGVCAANGQTACRAGAVVDTCEPGAPAQRADACDGEDSDCDGRMDEDFAAQETACGVGACAAGGQTQCVDGNVSDTCVEGQPSNEPDLCDGVDSDCDGEMDEDFNAEATNWSWRVRRKRTDGLPRGSCGRYRGQVHPLSELMPAMVKIQIAMVGWTTLQRKKPRVAWVPVPRVGRPNASTET